MIAGGAPITEVQHRLGHANPAITLQVYSHFFKRTEGNTADQLANALLNGVGSSGELQKSGHEVSKVVDMIAVSA
jgi:hypothetical protein